MSDSYRLMAVYSLRAPRDAMPRAKELAERALTLDPDQDEAYATLADVALTYDRDPAAAFRHWERALTLNPLHIRSRCEYAFWGLCCVRGSHDQAIAEVRRAMEADPLSSYAAGIGALTLAVAGRHPDALAEARRATELDPDNFFARLMLLQTSSWTGDHAGAIATSRPALAMSGRSPWALGALGAAYGRAGQRDAAEAIYAELSARARVEYVQETMIAFAAIGAGRLEEAMVLAERGADERDSMILSATGHPNWEPLRSHPRFGALRRRLGLE